MATPNLTAITAVAPKILASAQLASGDNTVYTAGASKAAKVATAILSNTTGTPVTISVSLVPSGGSVDSTHRVVSGITLAPGDSTKLTELEGCWLGAGDFISVNAGTAAAVDVTVTGLEFS